MDFGCWVFFYLFVWPVLIRCSRLRMSKVSKLVGKEGGKLVTVARLGLLGNGLE